MSMWKCKSCGHANSSIFSTCEKCETFRDDKEEE
jgi:predicted ATP-dependent serine protease